MKMLQELELFGVLKKMLEMQEMPRKAIARLQV